MWSGLAEGWLVWFGFFGSVFLLYRHIVFWPHHKPQPPAPRLAPGTPTSFLSPQSRLSPPHHIIWSIIWPGVTHSHLCDYDYSHAIRIRTWGKEKTPLLGRGRATTYPFTIPSWWKQDPFLEREDRGSNQRNFHIPVRCLCLSSFDSRKENF